MDNSFFILAMSKSCKNGTILSNWNHDDM